MILALSDDADSSYLVKECKELEEWFGLTFTDIILSGSLGSIRKMKKEMLALNKKKHADRCLEKAIMVAEVSRQIGWSRLWDAALHFGWKTVKGLQLLSRALSHHRRGNHPCHMLLHSLSYQCWITSWSHIGKSSIWIVSWTARS